MHRFLQVENGILKHCYMPKVLVLPPDITSIGKNAFLGCDGLEGVVIPEGVTSIGDGAFWGCTSLTSINIPDSVTSIGDEAFWGCDSLTLIQLPEKFNSASELKRIGITFKNHLMTA